MLKKVDNLIVGSGIAGVWMAFRMITHSKTFAIIDERDGNHSSRIAAGIYNPVLSKRQKVSFNARNIYPDLGKKYHELELYLHKKVCHKHHTAYILESLRELNDWAALSETDWFNDFVMIRNERISDNIISDFGYLDIQSSGWVDIPLLLDTFIDRIHSPNYYMNERFDESLLKCTDEGFEYNDIIADNIVFCQGTGIEKNALTSNIKLKPAKGEILEIEVDDLFDDVIAQNGVFMLPISPKKYKIGSNFTWEDLSIETTESAKEEIVQKFSRWYKGEFEITKQVAGIRPSSLDRRPLVGRLDFHPKAFLLNGFGSKGVSHAPYYSEMLYKCIYEGKEVDRDVDVKRFIR